MSAVDEQLNSVLQELEDCRSVLSRRGARETAELLSIAILDLKMKLNRVGYSELNALCDEMVRSAEPRQQQRRPVLRIVK